MKKWILGAIVLVSVLWFPHSLERIRQLGYDFPIYYEAGKGNFTSGWVYPYFTAVAFKPFTILPMGWAFAAWYSILVLVWLQTGKRLPTILLVATFYPMLLSLELGQTAPILAWLCLFPLGSIVAGCWKPYLFVFSLLHVARIRHKLRRRGDLQKSESDLSSNHILSLE